MSAGVGEDDRDEVVLSLNDLVEVFSRTGGDSWVCAKVVDIKESGQKVRLEYVAISPDGHAYECAKYLRLHSPNICVTRSATGIVRISDTGGLVQHGFSRSSSQESVHEECTKATHCGCRHDD